MRNQHVQKYWRERHSVVGAFWDIDFLLFDQILQMQSDDGVRGDLLEIGAFYGKSAIVLGCHCGPDEKVIVCDIFDDTGGDADNVAENANSYSGLNRMQFEENYQRWVDRSPVVLAELSEHIAERVQPRSLRFAHIDGSHLYHVVRADIANTRELMNNDGVVVLDDFRGVHTPGVSAAAWEAVTHGGLIPICVSEQKLYGAWNQGTARAILYRLMRWAASQGDVLNYGVQDVAGTNLLVIQNPPPWKKYKFVMSIPTPWTTLKIVIEIPALWRRHPAAPTLRDVLHRAWFRHHLGTRQTELQ